MLNLQVVKYRSMAVADPCYAIHEMILGNFYRFMYTEEWMADLVKSRILDNIANGRVTESQMLDFNFYSIPRRTATLPQSERPKLRVIHPMHR